jgi:hypothetical protein
MSPNGMDDPFPSSAKYHANLGTLVTGRGKHSSLVGGKGDRLAWRSNNTSGPFSPRVAQQKQQEALWP